MAALAASTLSLDRANELTAAARGTGSGEEVFATLVAVCGPHALATAFTASALMAGQAPELAYPFLDAVLRRFLSAESDLESLAAYLNAGQFTDLAAYVFTAASRTRPIETVLRHGEILRMRAHPEAVCDLLASVAAGRPGEIGRLLTALRHAGRDHEIGPVLDSLATGGYASPGYARREYAMGAVLLDTLMAEELQADAQTLVASLSRCPFVELAVIAVTVASPEIAAVLTEAMLTRPQSEAQACLDPRQPLTSDQLDRLVLQMMSTAPAQCPDTLVAWYANRAESAVLLWMIERLGQDGAPLDTVLSAAALRWDLEALCEALHQRGHHQVAYHLVALRAEYRL